MTLHFEGADAKEFAARVLRGLLKVVRGVAPTEKDPETGKMKRPRVAVVSNRIAFGTDSGPALTVIDVRPWEFCKKKSPVRDALADFPLTLLLDDFTAAPWLRSYEKNVLGATVLPQGGRITVLPGTVELDLDPGGVVDYTNHWSSRAGAILDLPGSPGSFQVTDKAMEDASRDGMVWAGWSQGEGFLSPAQNGGEYEARVPLALLAGQGKDGAPRSIWGAVMDEETCVVAVTTTTPEFTCRQIFRALRL